MSMNQYDHQTYQRKGSGSFCYLPFMRFLFFHCSQLIMFDKIIAEEDD